MRKYRVSTKEAGAKHYWKHTQIEAETLQIVIDFYNFAYKEKLKRNPQEVMNELLEAMMFTYTDGEEDSEK